MARPSRPLDPTAGPLQAFAAALRQLRADAGEPKYLQMARKTGKSRTALAEAAGGDHLPTWDTVAAFVSACGGESPDWRARWERTRDQLRERKIDTDRPDATEFAGLKLHQADVADAAALSGTRSRRLLRYATAALVGALVGASSVAIALPNRDEPAPKSGISRLGHPVGPAIIKVQNKVALGAEKLVEDSSPAYLSARTVPYCSHLSCELPGAQLGSGALLIAVCHTIGAEMFNYNLDSSESKSNPNRADSSLWYKVVLPDGRTGYLSEVYVVPTDRGGLGLPNCSRP